MTRASGRIGRRIAEAYAREEARVILASHNTEALGEAVDHITGQGGHGLAVQTDIASEADVQNLFKARIDRFSRTDIFINNAGVTAPGFPPTRWTWPLGNALSMSMPQAHFSAVGNHCDA